ncbi:MAG: prolipoprotein diacylglyceryl transferase [Polyangiales bacterium]|nr:prolipoprotein diacylglyceryl transferase [Myxococcales bacterium]MCB9656156.1 prolipoprotein diacylglyceryl transferase [Sandaracinaceae bacterium]
MHPILFEIPTPWGALPIYSYGMMLGFSLIVAWYFVMHQGQKLEGLHPDLMAHSFIITAVCAIAAARVLYIATNLDSYHTLGDLFSFQKGGLVAYGGFIGGFLACWGYSRYRGVPLLPWADIITPTLGTGLLFTRMGCWLYGCDFGRPLEEGAPSFLTRLGTFPHWDYSSAHYVWGSTLNGSPAYSHHITTYPERMVGLDHSLPVHPTQLYESLAGLIIFGITYYTLRHRSFKGQVFFVGSIVYALWRFGIEFVRDDPERGAAFGFSTSQLLSLAIVPVVVLAWIQTKRNLALNGEPSIPDSARSDEWLAEHRGIKPDGDDEQGGASDKGASAKGPKATSSPKGTGSKDKGKKKR